MPLPDQKAHTTAHAFVKRFVCVHGAPKAVLTDRGTNFLSILMKKVAKLFKIKEYRTTAFHPQSNGSLERSHHVLAEYLKKFANRNHDWDEWLELACFSYNTSVHEGTKFTPFELVYEKQAKLPSCEKNLDEDQLITYEDYLTKLLDKLSVVRKIGRINLIEAKHKSKTYYDRKLNVVHFEIGDKVMVKHGKKTGKLEDLYTGPHEVLHIFPNGTLKVSGFNKLKTMVVTPDRVHLSKI